MKWDVKTVLKLKASLIYRFEKGSFKQVKDEEVTVYPTFNDDRYTSYRITTD
jgi:hypothetical protein